MKVAICNDLLNIQPMLLPRKFTLKGVYIIPFSSNDRLNLFINHVYEAVGAVCLRSMILCG